MFNVTSDTRIRIVRQTKTEELIMLGRILDALKPMPVTNDEVAAKLSCLSRAQWKDAVIKTPSAAVGFPGDFDVWVIVQFPSLPWSRDIILFFEEGAPDSDRQEEVRDFVQQWLDDIRSQI